MTGNNHILNELNTISEAVANIPRSPVFIVPENYFADFPGKLMERIREDANIETGLLSPLLGGMQKKNPFSVPDGYFSTFEEQLKKSTLPVEIPEPAKVIRMSVTRQVWKLSVAAMIAGIIGITAWFFYQQNASVVTPSIVNVKSELPMVSEEEMNDFLLSVPEMPATETPQVAGLENLVIEDMLKDVQDGELQDYIKEMPDLQPEKLN